MPVNSLPPDDAPKAKWDAWIRGLWGRKRTKHEDELFFIALERFAVLFSEERQRPAESAPLAAWEAWYQSWEEFCNRYGGTNARRTHVVDLFNLWAARNGHAVRH